MYKIKMGFFENLRQGVSRGLMTVGGTLRRVASVSAPIIKKVGQVAGALKPLATMAGTSLAPFTGGASLAIGGAVSKGLGYVQSAGQRAEQIAGKVQQFGGSLQGLGQKLA